MPFDPNKLEQAKQSSGFDPAKLEAAKSSPQSVSRYSADSPGGLMGALRTTGNLLSGDQLPEGTNPKIQDAQNYLNKTRVMSGLDAIAGAGKYLNKKAQDASGWMAEKSGQYGLGPAGAVAGTALGTAAEALLPRDRLSAAGSIVGVAQGADEAAAKQAIKGYQQPSKTQRAVAEVMGVQSNVKPQHIAAVIANPEIMSDATPSMREVGKEYQKVFDRLGMQFDGAAYKDITGMRYPPNETQAAPLKKIVQNAVEKLENMKSRMDQINALGPGKIGKKALSQEEILTPAEAFLARSAGKKVLTGSVDAATKKLVASDVAMMDDFLENSGVPEIKALSHKYFQAAAKESLSEAIPKLRNGNPAVVRSMIMAHYGKEAALALAEGKPVKAMTNAAVGAFMSPKVQGKIIPFVAGPTSRVAKSSVIPAIAALENMRNDQ